LADSTVTLVEVAYFSGMFIGIVVELAVEIVIGILFTGGTLSVEAVLAKLGETFKALGKLLVGAIALPGKVAQKTITAFTNALKSLIEFLEKGTDEILKIIDDLFAKFKQVTEEIFLQGRNLQKGTGDLNKSFFENAGVKIERFISEVKVIGQTSDNTCVATSLRMVLEDKGILRAEEELARVLKTDSKGASILDIPEALYQKRLDEVVTIAEKKIDLSDLIKTLKEGDKAIVSVGTKKLGAHAMVLEKIENGKVFLRDPLPINKGASYIVSLEEFGSIFKRKAVIIKK
jgi:transcriptional regulator